MDELFKLMAVNLPNFLGLVFLAVVLYKVNDRQMTLIEKIVSECLEDEEDDQ